MYIYVVIFLFEFIKQGNGSHYSKAQNIISFLTKYNFNENWVYNYPQWKIMKLYVLKKLSS